MPLAKPNYAFQKRQRELAKKQKKEEKLKRRMEPGPGQEEAPVAPDEAAVPAVPVSGNDAAAPHPANGADAKA